VRLLAGPGSHQSPATAVPGPVVDHVPLMARWWDRWLRGAEPEPGGDDADITVFVRDYAAPEPDAQYWPGRWQAHDAAGLAARRELVLPLPAAIGRAGQRIVEYAGDLDVGVTAWNSCAGALPWGQPQDQTTDDARSLCLEWDAGAFAADDVVLGAPRLRLRVRCAAAEALLSAKLSLVPAAGRPSLLISRGVRDLVLRDAAGPAQACRPGEWLDVQLTLDDCAVRAASVGPGGRLRLALACADWPNVVAAGGWSAIDLDGATLTLPLAAPPGPQPWLPVPADQPDGDPAEAAAEPAAEPRAEPENESHVCWRHGHDVLARVTTAEVDHGSSYPGALDARCREHYFARLTVDRRTGASTAVATVRFSVCWPEPEQVTASSQAHLSLTAAAGELDVRLSLLVRDGETEVASRQWRRHLPTRYPARG
jgi:uncharacterized protein